MPFLGPALLALLNALAAATLADHFPALPGWVAYVAPELPVALAFVGQWIRAETSTPRGQRLGTRLEVIGYALEAALLAAALALFARFPPRYDPGFVRGAVALGLGASLLLLAVTVLRGALFGTDLLGEGHVAASDAPPWRRAWAALRIGGRWIGVGLVMAAFTLSGLLIHLDPRASAPDRARGLPTAVGSGLGLLFAGFMLRERWRALVPRTAGAAPPRRPGRLLARYRLDAHGLVEYRRGAELHVAWAHVRDVALGEYAGHPAVFVRADVAPGLAARPPRERARRLRQAETSRALAGAELVVLGFQSDLPLVELRARIAEAIGASPTRDVEAAG